MPYDISRVKVGDRVRDNQTRKEGRIVDITTVGQWGVILTIALVGAAKIQVAAVQRGAPAGTKPPSVTTHPTEQTGHPPVTKGVELETSSGSVSKRISTISSATDKEAKVVARRRGYSKPTWDETPEGLQRLRRFIEEAPKRGATIPEMDRKRLIDLVDRLTGREIDAAGKNTGRVTDQLRIAFRRGNIAIEPSWVQSMYSRVESELRSTLKQVLRQYIPGAAAKDMDYLVEFMIQIQRGSTPGMPKKLFDYVLGYEQTLLDITAMSRTEDYASNLDRFISSMESKTGLNFTRLRNIKRSKIAEVGESQIRRAEILLHNKEMGLPTEILVGQRAPDAEIRNLTGHRFNIGAVNHALDSDVTMTAGLSNTSLAELRQAVQRFNRMAVYRDGWEAVRDQAELIAEGVIEHNLFASAAFDANEMLQTARQLQPGKMGVFYRFQDILRQTYLMDLIKARNEGTQGPDEIMENQAPQIERSRLDAQQAALDDISLDQQQSALRQKLRAKRMDNAAVEKFGEDLRWGKETIVDTEQGLRITVKGMQTTPTGDLEFFGRVASSSVRDPGEFGLLTNVPVVSDARTDVLSAMIADVRGPDMPPELHPAIAGAVDNPAVTKRLDAMSVKVGNRSVRVTDFLRRTFSDIAPETQLPRTSDAYEEWLRSQLKIAIKDKTKIIQQTSGGMLVAGDDALEDALSEAWIAYYNALGDGKTAKEIHEAAFSTAYKRGLATLYAQGQEVNLTSLGVESIWDLPGVGDTAGVITKEAEDARRLMAGEAADYLLENRPDLVRQKILDDMSLMLDIDRDFIPVADPTTGEHVYLLGLKTHINRDRARTWYNDNAQNLLDLNSYTKEGSHNDFNILREELSVGYSTPEGGVLDDYLFDNLYEYLDDLDTPIREEHQGLAPLINRARASLRGDRELIKRTYVTAHVASNTDPLPPGLNALILRGEQEKPLLTTVEPVGGRRVVYTASADLATGPNGRSVALSPEVEATIPSRFVLKDRGIDARDQEYLQHLIDNYSLSAEEAGVYNVGGRTISTGDTSRGLRRQIERLYELQNSREAQQVLFLDIEAETAALRDIPSVGALEVPATTFAPNQRVKHPLLGEGSVVSYVKDGTTAHVTVQFDAGTVKTFDPSTAGLLRGVTRTERSALVAEALKNQTEMAGTSLTEIGIVPGQVSSGKLTIDLPNSSNIATRTAEEEIDAIIGLHYNLQHSGPTIFTRNKLYDMNKLLERAKSLLGGDNPYTRSLQQLVNDATDVVNIDTMLVADIANPDERYQSIQREIRTRAARDPEFRKITGEEYVPNEPESHRAIPDIVDDASLTARNLETEEARRFVSDAIVQLRDSGDFVAQDLVGKQYWTNTGFNGERSRLLTLRAVVRESEDSNNVRYIWSESVLNDAGELVDGGLYSPRSSETLVFKQHKLLRGMQDVTDYTDTQKADLLRQTEEDYAGRIARDMRQDPTRYAKEVKRLQMIDEFRGQDPASILARLKPYIDDVTMSTADLPEGLDTVVQQLRTDYTDQQALAWLAEWGRDPRRRRQTERLRALLDQEFGTIHRQFYNDLEQLQLGSSNQAPLTLHEKQKILERYHGEVDDLIGAPAPRADWGFMPGTRKISATIADVSDWPMGFNIDSPGAFLNDFDRQVDRIIEGLGPGQVQAALENVLDQEQIDLFQNTVGMKERMFVPFDPDAGRAGIGKSYAGVRALRQHVWEHTVFPALRANLDEYIAHSTSADAAAVLRRAFATPEALHDAIMNGELSEDVFHAFRDADPRMYHAPRSVTDEQLEQIRAIQQRILGGADAEGHTWRDYAGISESYNSAGELLGYERPSLDVFPAVEGIHPKWYGKTIDEIQASRADYYLAEKGAEKAAGAASFWMNQQLHTVFMRQDVFESLPSSMQQNVLDRVDLNVLSVSGESTDALNAQRTELLSRLRHARQSGDAAYIEELTADLADVEHELYTIHRDLGQIRAGLGDIDIAADLVADKSTSTRVIYELTSQRSMYNKEIRDMIRGTLIKRLTEAESVDELLEMPYPEDPRFTIGGAFEETSLRDAYLEKLGLGGDYNMSGGEVTPPRPQPQAEAFGASTSASAVDEVAEVVAAADTSVEQAVARSASTIPSKFAMFRTYSSKVSDILEYAKSVPYLVPIAIGISAVGATMMAQKPNLDDQEPENPIRQIRDKIEIQTTRPVASRTNVRLRADSDAPGMEDMQMAIISATRSTMQQHHSSAIRVTSINTDRTPRDYTRRDVDTIAGQLMSPGRPIG